MAKAKAKKKTAAKAKPKKQAKKVAKRKRDAAVDAVSELISVLACPKSAVNELALSAENVLDQMDVACGFARFAASTWAARPRPNGEIEAIARLLIDEYERHAAVLVQLLDRLAPLAEEEEHADHDDLDPHDVLERVGPMLESTGDAAQA